MTEKTIAPRKWDKLAPGVQPLESWRGYGLVVLSLVLALGIRSALDPMWGDRLPFVTFFLAELVLVQFVGIGPFLAAMFGGLLAGDWFFVSPRHVLLISERVSQVNAAFYLVLSLALLFFALRTRRALAREQEAQREIARQQAELSRLAAIVESSHDAIIGETLDGAILSWNAGAERLYGYTPAEVLGKSISVIMPPDHAETSAPLLEQMRRGERVSHFESVRRSQDGRLIPVSLSMSPVHDSQGVVIGAASIARDISEAKRAGVERERLLSELQAALANVKTLSGLLPICASCKKIRDDKGYWNQIETYIHEHAAVTFTHGICPDCARTLYPEAFRLDPPAASSGSP